MEIILTKKEKKVLIYLCSVCLKKRTYLISPSQIAFALSKDFVLSIVEIDEIMSSLSKDDYLDFVVSETKNDYLYCITMKKKGQNFERKISEQKKAFYILVLKTLFLALISFLFGLILKAIFS